LTLAARLHGDDVARALQLQIEYDPQPPFNCGSPRVADAELMSRVSLPRRAFQEERRAQVMRLAGESRLTGESRNGLPDRE